MPARLKAGEGLSPGFAGMRFGGPALALRGLLLFPWTLFSLVAGSTSICIRSFALPGCERPRRSRRERRGCSGCAGGPRRGCERQPASSPHSPLFSAAYSYDLFLSPAARAWKEQPAAVQLARPPACLDPLEPATSVAARPPALLLALLSLLPLAARFFCCFNCTLCQLAGLSPSCYAASLSRLAVHPSAWGTRGHPRKTVGRRRGRAPETGVLPTAVLHARGSRCRSPLCALH